MKLCKLPDSYQSAELDGELVMIHGDTGKFYALKDVGLDIWRKLDDQPDVDLLCEELISEYDAEGEAVRKAVGAFLDDLVSIGFAEYR